MYMEQKLKTTIQMERHFKGLANHHRLSILLLLEKESNLTVENISTGLDVNFKTISQHTGYLMRAGLLEKRYKGRMVLNTLSPYGKIFVKFIKKFQSIHS